jgi:ABC-type glycerol-3-phosphate transport system substrate-binding protein
VRLQEALEFPRIYTIRRRDKKMYTRQREVFKKCVGLFLLLSFVVGVNTGILAKEEVTITMWTHDFLYVKFFKARAEEWKEKYPQYDFKFDFIQIPYAQVFTKVLNTFSAGMGAPDLVGIEISAFSRFMKDDIAEKCLVDLTPLIGKERKLFVEGRWTPYMYKGKIYGVESALCPVVFYYRDDVFKEAGIKMPIDTYEEFVAAGEKIKAMDKFIIAAPRNGQELFMILFQQQGGNVFTKDGKLAISDPRAVNALKFLVDGALNKKIFYPSEDLYGAPLMAAYKQSKVVGAIMPDWYLVYYLKSQVPELSGKWRIQEIPAWKPGGLRVSTWGGTGFAITKQSQHPDLVWDLLHYTYMTKENQVKRFLEIGYYPTMIEAMEDPRVKNFVDPYCGDQKIGEVFSRVAKKVPIQWQSPYWNEAMTVIQREVSFAMNGKKSPEQAIRDMDKGIKALMK